MSESLAVVTKVLQALTADLSQESAKAWSAIVPVYQINAMTHLVYGGIALIVMIGCIVGGFVVFGSFKKRAGQAWLHAEIDPVTPRIIFLSFSSEVFKLSSPLPLGT